MEVLSVLKSIFEQYGQIGVLLLIFASSVFQCIQKHGSIKVQKEQMKTQKAQCEGNFKLHEVEIKNVNGKADEARRDSKEALIVSKQALDCATKMGAKVTTISENVEAFMSGKYGEQHEKNNI